MKSNYELFQSDEYLESVYIMLKANNKELTRSKMLELIESYEGVEYDVNGRFNYK